MPRGQGVKGHIKGPKAEIEVAKILWDWWKSVDPKCRFKRTPMSGGWGDHHVRGDFKVAGDICTTSNIWPFTVEVKRREGWSYGSFVRGRKSPVWHWWGQCIKAAAEEDRVPLMWMRQNRQPWLVLAPERTLVPILTRRNQVPDILFKRLSPKVDYHDIKPAVVFGENFLKIPATAWLTRAQRSKLSVG